MKTVERERKSQQSKNQREHEQDEWAVPSKKGGSKKIAEEVQDIEDDDSRYDEEDAIDMRREDAELE